MKTMLNEELLRMKALGISDMSKSLESVIDESVQVGKVMGLRNVIESIGKEKEFVSHKDFRAFTHESAIIKQFHQNGELFTFAEAKRICEITGLRLPTFYQIRNLDLRYRYNISSTGWSYNRRVSVPGPDSYNHYYWDYMKFALPIWIEDDDETEDEAYIVNYERGDVDQEHTFSSYYSYYISLKKEKVSKPEKHLCFFCV